jgi:hypothetical protein
LFPSLLQRARRSWTLVSLAKEKAFRFRKALCNCAEQLLSDLSLASRLAAAISEFL